MNRKDKTVKQLQAECRKKKIGFMMNWTKIALIKRLEDEDKRDKNILSLKKELDKSKKAMLMKEKATKDLKTVLEKRELEINEALNAAPTPAQLTKEAKDRLIQTNNNKLITLQKSFDKLNQREIEIAEENNKVADEKLKIYREMVTIKELIASLK